jgi:hypothetical protein
LYFFLVFLRHNFVSVLSLTHPENAVVHREDNTKYSIAPKSHPPL